MDPEEYEHLLLDGVACPFIFESDKIFLEQFINVITFSLNSCALKNLENFPCMDKVTKLEMNDNKISTGLEYIARSLPNLEALKLGNNNISTIKELQKLESLSSLKNLEVVGNPVCELCNY